MRIPLQPAFVLHHRPYRETSVLLDLLTKDYGRISACARGVRKPRSRLRSLLEPFIPLLISWQGKTELMTLIDAEMGGPAQRLVGNALLSGLYLNELLMRVLQKQDPHPAIYTIYQQTLLELHQKTPPEKSLRLFEKKLLEELGFGLQLTQDASSREAIVAAKNYRFHSEHGFEVCEENQGHVFSGRSLIALSEEKLNDAHCLRDAKRLMRLALAPLIGAHPLNSRKLYAKIEV